MKNDLKEQLDKIEKDALKQGKSPFVEKVKFIMERLYGKENSQSNNNKS